ncbi:MAG: hypothetical protein P8X42_04960 [Calditrichaceae bacterium]|jgi:hypothetical protein
MGKINLSAKISQLVFIGWQDRASGKAIAFYNITGVNHPAFDSALSEVGSKKLNLKVPKIK